MPVKRTVSQSGVRSLTASGERNMDASAKTCLLFALSEHRKLMNRFLVHVNEELEEQKKRTR